MKQGGLTSEKRDTNTTGEGGEGYLLHSKIYYFNRRGFGGKMRQEFHMSHTLYILLWEYNWSSPSYPTTTNRCITSLQISPRVPMKWRRHQWTASEITDFTFLYPKRTEHTPCYPNLISLSYSTFTTEFPGIQIPVQINIPFPAFSLLH